MSASPCKIEYHDSLKVYEMPGESCRETLKTRPERDVHRNIQYAVSWRLFRCLGHCREAAGRDTHSEDKARKKFSEKHPTSRFSEVYQMPGTLQRGCRERHRRQEQKETFGLSQGLTDA